MYKTFLRDSWIYLPGFWQPEEKGIQFSYSFRFPFQSSEKWRLCETQSVLRYPSKRDESLPKCLSASYQGNQPDHLEWTSALKKNVIHLTNGFWFSLTAEIKFSIRTRGLRQFSLQFYHLFLSAYSYCFSIFSITKMYSNFALVTILNIDFSSVTGQNWFLGNSEH